MANKENYTADISAVNNAIANMKRQTTITTKATQMKIREYGGPTEIQTSFAKALNSLQKSTVVIANNLGKLAVATSRTINSSVAQYSKAISEDINVNKQNLVATALAQTTPIFGYFVAKFMETDVFRKLREKVSDMFSGLATKAKEFVFKKHETPKSEKTVTIPKPQVEKIPKLQTGGLVEKSGLVKVHAGEVVAPIQDVLKRVDESISTTRRLARISQITQLNSVAHMSSFVKAADTRTKQGIIKGFLTAYEDVHKEYEEPANIRLLRAVLAIQDTLGAQMGKWKQIWARMLLEHPVLRHIVFSLRMIKQVIGLPFKLMYPFIKSRGGYRRDLSHSRNPFEAIAENIGITYIGTMWRLDNIALYTKATAQAVRDLSSFVTGYSYESIPGLKKGEWSIFGLLRSGLKFTLSKTLGLTGKGISQIEKNLLGYKPVVGSILRRAGQMIQKGIESPALTTKAKREKFYESGLQRTTQFIGFGNKIKPTTQFSSPIIIVSEIHLERMQKSWKQYVNNNKKLLKISQKNSTLTQRLLKRGKSFFSSIFTRVITFLPIVGSILAKTLFSGAKITKFISSIVFKVLKGSTKFLFKTVVSGGLEVISNLPRLLLASIPRIAPLIGTALGPALGIAVAGTIGWNLGKRLDNWLGISKKFQAYLHKHDEEIHKLQATTSKALQEHVIKARKESGTAEGFTAKEKVGVVTSVSRFGKERFEDVGFFGRRFMSGISSGQTQFLQEHIEEYLKYGSDQVNQLRGQWLKKGGFYRTKSIGENPIEYGRKREKAFLDYLKQKGKPLSAIEREKRLQAYKTKYGTWKSKLKEHWGEVKDLTLEEIASGKSKTSEIFDYINKEAPEAKAYIRKTANQFVLQSKPIIEEIKNQNKVIKELTKESTQKVSQGIRSSATVISQNVNNVTTVLRDSNKKLQKLTTDSYNILSGRLSQNCPFF